MLSRQMGLWLSAHGSNPEKLKAYVQAFKTYAPDFNQIRQLKKLKQFRLDPAFRAQVLKLISLRGFKWSKPGWSKPGWRRPLALAFPASLLLLVAAPGAPTPGVTLPENAFQMASLAPSPMAAKLAELAPLERMGYRPAIDTAIEQIYYALSQNDLNQALSITNQLLEEFPNFTLGYLIRGDILSLKAGRELNNIGDVSIKLPNTSKAELGNLRAEAIARFKAVKDRPSGDLLPAELLVLEKEQKYVILVDAGRSRLFLYQNALPHPRLITDFYISQGKLGAVKTKEGDKRTPIGVYTITELLPKEKLNEFYGPIALPINYPNAWDKRQGKTGSGIWLHGMPESFASRPPRDSDGCVVLANQDLMALKPYVDIGTTQVIISKNLDFVPTEVWMTQRRAALRVVKTWKDDIEKGIDLGAMHYSPDVLIDGQDLMTWQKENSLTQKGLGNVRIDDLSVMKYPYNESDMMLVTFNQTDPVSGHQRKHQYWMKIGTRWAIVQEDSEKL
ncbi:MAG: L,D-transpeptidase family protein [Limnobacter sp.]|nr:L,D-transpeptidase family protein [Limnobacter sp.]